MQSKAVAVFCLLLALCLIGGVHAAKKDKGQRRGPQYDFSACGGAKACLGEAKLNQVLAKTGLNQHKTVDDLAQLLDTDDDLVSRRNCTQLTACPGTHQIQFSTLPVCAAAFVLCRVLTL